MNTPLRWAARTVASVALVAAIIFLYYRMLPVNATTIALTMLLAILGIATKWGLAESIVASITAMLGFNYFFCRRWEHSPSRIRRTGSRCWRFW